MLKYLILLLSFSSLTSFGTTFVPVPIKDQIKESSAIVQGEIINFESEEEESGKIVTKVFIRADKWVDTKPEAGHLTFYVPGGQVGDRIYQVEGSPKFSIGEKVVLFLKEHNNKLWIQNLALGKYMIRKYGRENILVNSVFPEHPKIGQIPLSTFQNLTQRIKNTKFKIRFKDKYEIHAEKKSLKRVGRKIASVETTNKESSNQLNTFWILVSLGLLCGIVTYIRKKHSE